MKENKDFEAEFANLSDEEKITYISEHPEAVLCMDDVWVGLQENFSSNFLQQLKLTAIKSDPHIIEQFEKYGLSLNQQLVDEALNGSASVMKVVPEQFLNVDNIHKCVRRNSMSAMYIPYNFMDENMYAYCNKYIRKAIKGNVKRYYVLPDYMRNMHYSATNALVDNSNANILKLNKDQLELNGGKIMYKVAKQDPSIALKLDPEVLRKKLVITMVKTEPEIYAKLPIEYKNDQTVKYAVYVTLRKNKQLNKLDIFLDPQDTKIVKHKYNRVQKARKTREENKQAQEELIKELQEKEQ